MIHPSAPCHYSQAY